MTESSPPPREILEALFPGAFDLKVSMLSAGAAGVGLLLAVLSVSLTLSFKGQVALAGAGLAAWGHGAAWLVNGELGSGPSALANFAGARWGVFFALWWAPVTILWIGYGLLAQ